MRNTQLTSDCCGAIIPYQEVPLDFYVCPFCLRKCTATNEEWYDAGQNKEIEDIFEPPGMEFYDDSVDNNY